MSYQQQGDQQGYGQYNPYGQSGNPYGQQGNPYQDQGNPYGHQATTRPQAEPQGSSYYPQDEEQGGGRYEMANMNGNDPNRILNETRDIDRAIDEIEGDIERLKMMQVRAIRDTEGPESRIQSEVNTLSERLIEKYQALTSRIKRLKSNPESGNPRNAPQVGKVDRRLKKMIQTYQRVDSDYRAGIKDTIARQYRIVRPDASDAEVREVTEDTSGNTQIFSQALINSDRRGEAQTISRHVRSRHEAIQKIERDMLILAQMFQDLEAAVIQQEPAVTQIEQRGEEVNEHVAKANTELTGAVDKARAARRKKWWCLGIAVLIVIIIAVVVAVAVTVTKK